VDDTDIMAITGHKNQRSLTDCGKIDEDDHQNIGNSLSNDVEESAVEPIMAQVQPDTSITQVQPASSLVQPTV
jgi:hypothetical protein